MFVWILIVSKVKKDEWVIILRNLLEFWFENDNFFDFN